MSIATSGALLGCPPNHISLPRWALPSVALYKGVLQIIFYYQGEQCHQWRLIRVSYTSYFTYTIPSYYLTQHYHPFCQNQGKISRLQTGRNGTNVCLCEGGAEELSPADADPGLLWPDVHPPLHDHVWPAQHLSLVSSERIFRGGHTKLAFNYVWPTQHLSLVSKEGIFRGGYAKNWHFIMLGLPSIFP